MPWGTRGFLRGNMGLRVDDNKGLSLKFSSCLKDNDKYTISMKFRLYYVDDRKLGLIRSPYDSDTGVVINDGIVSLWGTALVNTQS